MAKAKKINLALQGGGAHGAYTWGVLDRLLEEESLEIEGISGTSAGAMNAAMLVSGYAKGGREGAKRALHEFWRRVSDGGVFSFFYQNPAENRLPDPHAAFSYRWLDLLTRSYSPYVLNPLNLNPLKRILDDMLDVRRMRKSGIKLFVAATHVGSGQARIFGGDEITTDVLLASSGIPFYFQAVEIGGEYYWDGCYMGNPAIWPLIYKCKSEDVVLVQINPIHTEKLPKTADEIIDRLNEITFNSSLIAEMRAIEFVSRLLKKKQLSSRHYKNMRIHVVYSPETMRHLNAASKLNINWDFFLFLKKQGRKSAEAWLKKHKKDLGVRGSVDIRRKFLCGPPRKAKRRVKKTRR